MTSPFGCVELKHIHSEQNELKKMQYEFQSLLRKPTFNYYETVTKCKEQIQLKQEKINKLTKDYLLTCSW